MVGGRGSGPTTHTYIQTGVATYYMQMLLLGLLTVMRPVGRGPGRYQCVSGPTDSRAGAERSRGGGEACLCLCLSVCLPAWLVTKSQSGCGGQTATVRNLPLSRWGTVDGAHACSLARLVSEATTECPSLRGCVHAPRSQASHSRRDVIVFFVPPFFPHAPETALVSASLHPSFTN